MTDGPDSYWQRHLRPREPASPGSEGPGVSPRAAIAPTRRTARPQQRRRSGVTLGRLLVVLVLIAGAGAGGWGVLQVVGHHKNSAHSTTSPHRRAATVRLPHHRRTAPRYVRPSGTQIVRDANGFALGGPPAPTAPSNYAHPSHAECLRYRDQVRAWSNYQNLHRPRGATNDLPTSGEVQYLYVVCGLNY